MFSPRQDRDNALLREHLLPVLERHRVDLVLQGHDHVYGRRGGLVEGQGTPQYVVSVTGAKQYRPSDRARRPMDPVAEDTSSDERRVGKEWGRTWRSRGTPDPYTK